MQASTDFDGTFAIKLNLSLPELINLREDLWAALGEDGREDYPTLNKVLVEVAGVIQLVEKGYSTRPI